MKCGADIKSTATANRGREQDLTMGATLAYIGPSGRPFLPRTIFVVPTIQPSPSFSAVAAAVPDVPQGEALPLFIKAAHTWERGFFFLVWRKCAGIR